MIAPRIGDEVIIIFSSGHTGVQYKVGEVWKISTVYDQDSFYWHIGAKRGDKEVMLNYKGAPVECLHADVLSTTPYEYPEITIGHVREVFQYLGGYGLQVPHRTLLTIKTVTNTAMGTKVEFEEIAGTWGVDSNPNIKGFRLVPKRNPEVPLDWREKDEKKPQPAKEKEAALHKLSENVQLNGKWQFTNAYRRKADELVKEARNKGYVKGAVFKDLVNGLPMEIIADPIYTYYTETDCLYVSVTKPNNSDKHPKYDNRKSARIWEQGSTTIGKWAYISSVVPQSFTPVITDHIALLKREKDDGLWMTDDRALRKVYYDIETMNQVLQAEAINSRLSDDRMMALAMSLSASALTAKSTSPIMPAFQTPVTLKKKTKKQISTFTFKT
jgi:hypothetical protein